MMFHSFMEKGAWFRAKKFGYGAGLPFKWQGWALIAFYLMALAGISVLSKQESAIPQASAFAMFLVVTAIFIAIARRRTNGSWKWRWGDNA
jgi:hypothetical protein